MKNNFKRNLRKILLLTLAIMITATISTKLTYAQDIIDKNLKLKNEFTHKEKNNLKKAKKDITDKFSDRKFKSIVYEIINKDSDERIYKEDLKGISKLNINSKNISDLSGIEYFEDLEKLDCSSNMILKLDLSKNKNLKVLDCSVNGLRKLNIEGLKKLKNLKCYNNHLSVLNLKSNSNLKKLKCHYNSIEELDLKNKTKLKLVYCHKNKLKELNTESNPKLKDLDCGDNEIKILNINKNKNLENLDCSNNKLRKLNVKFNVELKELRCSNNNLTKLDLKSNYKLENLYCSLNKLIELDVTSNKNLSHLDCYNNYISDKSKVKGVGEKVYFTFEPQKEIKNHEIKIINGKANKNKAKIGEEIEIIAPKKNKKQFKNWKVNKGSIELENKTKNPTTFTMLDDDVEIEAIYIDEIEVESIKLDKENLNLKINEEVELKAKIEPENAKNKTLTWMSSDENIAKVDGNGKVKAINIGQATITVKSVNDKKATCKVKVVEEKEDEEITDKFTDENFRKIIITLFDINKDGKIYKSEVSNVEILDVSMLGIKNLSGIEYFVNLQLLDCSTNELNKLNFKNNKKLKTLNCSYNNLNKLDLKYNTELEYITCYHNKLTELDLTNNKNVQSLIGYDNNIDSKEKIKGVSKEKWNNPFFSI